MRRSVTGAVVALGLVGVAGPAVAAWTSAGSGAAPATARSLLAVTGQQASAAGTTVTVSWTSGANPGGTVHRVVRNSTPNVTLACTSSPCTDSGAPSGTYSYTMTPKLSSWNGPAASTAAVTVAAVTPQTAAPSTPDMASTSDSGASSTDNVTNVARPVFQGTAAANALVRLSRAGVEVGSQQLSGGATSWSITPTTDLAEGVGVSITATAHVAGQLVSAASGGLPATFDRTAPVVTATAPAADDSQNKTVNGTAGTAAGDGPTVAVSATRTAGAGSCGLNPATAAPVSATGAWTVTVALDKGATCRLVATQTDTAGNVSSTATVDVVRG